MFFFQGWAILLLIETAGGKVNASSSIKYHQSDIITM